MTRTVRAELFKLVRRRATWLSIAGLGALPVLLGLFLRLVPAVGPDGQPAPGVTANGYVLFLMTLSTAMLLFAPLVSAFIGAELLAQETADGTLKLSLVRPVSRAQVLLAKCLACAAHNLALVAALWLATLVVGTALLHFGPPTALTSVGLSAGLAGGDATTVGEVSVAGVMSQGEALLRFAGAYAYLALPLTAIGLLALLWSTVIKNAAGVVVATLAVIVGMRAFEGLRGVPRYLLSTHLVSQSLLASPTDWAALARSLAVLAAYAAVFMVAAALILRRRDITT